MTELAVRADLPVESPAVTLQGADDVSYLHAPRVRERCDDLIGEQSPSWRDRCPQSQSSRRGKSDATKTLVAGVAPPASQNANLEPLIEGPAISLAARHAKVRRDGYAR